MKGTTPYHIFKIPVPFDTISVLRVAYAQCDEILFVKELHEFVELPNDRVMVHLAQEDTMKIRDNCHHKIAIQMKIRTKDDEVFHSYIERIKPGELLEEGEI